MFNWILDWLFGRFVCPYCKKRFRTEAKMIAHIKEKHPGKRIPIAIGWS